MRDGAPFKRRKVAKPFPSRGDLMTASVRTNDDTDKTVSGDVSTLYIIRGADGRPVTTRFTKYAAKKRAQDILGATIEKVRVCPFPAPATTEE
jgi:predicted ThiF/HesA family dinucleotide-utilizing enzyme